MNKKIKKMVRDESGGTMVLVAVMLTVLVMFLAITFDMGLLYLKESKIQTACDSAALAGAAELDGTCAGETKAKKAAEDYLVANGIDLEDVTIELSADPSDSEKQLIKVTKKERVKTSFATVMNFNAFNAKKSATASGGSTPTQSLFAPDWAFFSTAENDTVKVKGTLTVNGDAHVGGELEYDTSSTRFDFNGILEYDKINNPGVGGTLECDSDKTTTDILTKDSNARVVPDYTDELLKPVKEIARVTKDNLDKYKEANPGCISADGKTLTISGDVEINDNLSVPYGVTTVIIDGNVKVKDFTTPYYGDKDFTLTIRNGGLYCESLNILNVSRTIVDINGYIVSDADNKVFTMPTIVNNASNEEKIVPIIAVFGSNSGIQLDVVGNYDVSAFLYSKDGQITIQREKVEITGAVIAKEIDSSAAKDITVTYPSSGGWAGVGKPSSGSGKVQLVK